MREKGSGRLSCCCRLDPSCLAFRFKAISHSVIKQKIAKVSLFTMLGISFQQVTKNDATADERNNFDDQNLQSLLIGLIPYRVRGSLMFTVIGARGEF